MAITIIAGSDCLDVQDHEDTVLIKYSNAVDFAGISYDAGTEFSIRVPGMFFKERFPDENESEKLSDNSVDKLSGTVKSQKLLVIDAAPYYWHKMLSLILQHNEITIDDVLWVKEEPYEMKPINDGHPFERAQCWLTQKEDGFFINVYS